MTEREENIVEAASRVFTRYGVKRTTMNDIASEAGLVRQTLYTVYKSKDEVLCAVIRHYTDQALEEVRRQWEAAGSLGEKLDIYFDVAILPSFRMVRESPDADDVVSGFNNISKDELDRAFERKRQALAEMLAPETEALARSGETVDTLADFIQSASAKFKHTARDEAHLMTLLGTLKAVVIAIAER